MITKQIKLLGVAALALLLLVMAPLSALAAVQAPSPAARVSFTFDDGYASALTQAAPTLAKYGFSATDYVATGCVGMVTAPNTCRANTDATYMSWAQVATLQNTYKWEIGSHTVTHPYLATSDATDGQPNVLTPAQIDRELSQSKADLLAHGFSGSAFATPYGDYNNQVLADIAKYYSSQRGFADIGYNSWPNSDYFLKVQQVQGGVSVASVKKYIDTAAANNQWLILVFHDIKQNASTRASDYEYSTANLDQIAAYVKSKNLPATNISTNLVSSDTNLLANGSFNAGITNGWSTDAPGLITSDSAGNGSYPDPTNSIKLVSSASNTVHLFSPPVAIDPSATYMLKNFLDVAQNGGDEVAFYIDEYNASGGWISGQYKAAERGSFVEDMNFAYKATSSSVRKAALQVVVTPTPAAGGTVAYLDNSQWFPLTAVNSPPVSTNLMPNGSFDSGMGVGWRTDSPATITPDSSGNGSPDNPINSIKMISLSKNTHLFSPRIAASAANSYGISSYLNLAQIGTGEVGYYIDEYDASGNWVSGQYKTGVTTAGAKTVSFQYKPSSALVASASLQIISVGNSNATAYVDNVSWIQN